MWVVVGALIAWITSAVPLIVQAPLKVTALVWGGILTLALLIVVKHPARSMSLVFAALLCFPAVDYLSPPPFAFVGGAPGGLAYYPGDIFLIASAVLALAQGILRLPSRYLWGLLTLGVIYWLTAAGGVLVSPRPLESWMQWMVLLRAIAAAVVVSAAARGGGGRSMVLVLLAGVVIQGGVAWAQQVHQGSLGLAPIGEAPEDQLFKYISPGVRLQRSGGTLGHPNALASYAVALLPVAAGVALTRGPFAHRVIGAAAACAASLALLWTYSRAAWAVALVTAVVLAVCAGRSFVSSRRNLLIAGAGTLLALAVLPSVRHRLGRTESSATEVRVDLVSVASAMVRAYPVSGVGLNQFPRRIPEFDPEMRLAMFHHPVHNIVLLDAAETGLLGGFGSLLMWCGGLAVIAIRLCSAVRQRATESAGLWMGCAALILHNALDWTLRQPAIMLLFWILAALASHSSVLTDRIQPAGSRASDAH